MSKPPESDRPMGKSTLAVEKEKLLLEKRKMELAAEDKARDDRRAMVRQILMTLTLIVAMGLIGAALFWGRAFVFSGFGIEAKTGAHL